MWPFRVSDATQKAVDEVVKKRKYEAVQDAQEEYERKQAEKKKARIDELSGMIETMMSATPAIDFLQMQVVSIERAVKPIQVDGENFSILVTIIGHIVRERSDNASKAELREWTLHCNQEHHEKLVEEFNDFIKRRNKGERVLTNSY
jgi:hypothetical protein